MTYEYRCKDCAQTFEVTATIAEKERGLHPRCPHCGSEKISQVFTAVGVLLDSGGRPPGGSVNAPACGPGFGAGCCG